MKRQLVTIVAVLLTVCSAFGAGFRPYALKCESLDSPLGIDSTQPHFSWKISSSAPMFQSAYEIQVASSAELLELGNPDLWNPGKVSSADQVMVPYAGKDLQPRQLCFWRVRVFDGGGNASEWSSVQRFSIGVIAPDALGGDYIGAVPGEGRSSLLHKSFKLKKAPGTAFLHVNSLGYHEVYVNGHKVTESVLAPAVSQLDRRSLIVTYDVSDCLMAGENHIVLWLGSGWYKSGTFGAVYEGGLVKADLDILGKDGWSTVLSTDSSWEGCESGYSDTGSWRPGDFGGERIDAAKVPASLDALVCLRLPWQKVDVEKPEGIKTSPQMCEGNVIRETLEPVSLIQLSKDEWIADFGKAMNAQFQTRLSGLEKGHEVKVTFADNLNEDGTLDGRGSDIFVSSGREGGDLFSEKFNHHCFRYVLFRNLPVKPAEIRAFRFSAGYDTAASFQCSDVDMNRIHDLLAYTMNNLSFSGYMVDCAHIERLGYGGDGNASTLSLQTLYDVAPLYMNWLQAWNDAITAEDGAPHTAPNPYRAGGGPYWCSFIVQAPWRSYMSYADKRPLERCYDSMKTWLGYVDRYSEDGLLKKWPDVERRYWYLGDWLAPDGTDVTLPESVELVNNCALSQSYADLVKIARLLGHEADAKEYQARLAALNSKIHSTFWHDGIYGTGSQLDMSYPLLVGAVPEELKDSVVKALYERTREINGGHIGVGLVGVPVLTEWATLSRSVGYMYEMLKKRDYPGYLFMLDNGATGTWESWSGRRSRIHNCYNGVFSWFYQALAGLIADEPGYRHVQIDPQVPEGINWLRCTKETPYGTILISWEKKDSGLQLHLDIPVGVSASVRGQELSCGKYDLVLGD